MIINKKSVEVPIRRRETVPFMPLGENAEVIIQQMSLDRYLMSFGIQHTGMIKFAAALAECVLDIDDEPIMTEEQWNNFGMQHVKATMDLYERIRKLSSMDLEAAGKN